MNYRMFSARLIYKKVMNLGISPLFLCLLYKLLQPVPQFFLPLVHNFVDHKIVYQDKTMTMAMICNYTNLYANTVFTYSMK